MATTLDQLHREIISLRKAMLQIQRELQVQARAREEDAEGMLELADDVVADIAASRKRKSDELIPLAAVLKRYRMR